MPGKRRGGTVSDRAAVAGLAATTRRENRRVRIGDGERHWTEFRRRFRLIEVMVVLLAEIGEPNTIHPRRRTRDKRCRVIQQKLFMGGLFDERIVRGTQT